jgi:hypothetical protein
MAKMHILIVSLALGCAAVLAAQEGAQNADLLQRIELRLGPGAVKYVPDDLTGVTQMFPAAVVADIVDVGPLAFQDRKSPKGVLLGTDGLAPYRLRVTEVIYNRLADAKPSLVPGTEFWATENVGRDEAKAFVEKRAALATKGQYLFFLWYRQNRQEWGLASSEFQFRRSPSDSTRAETVMASNALKWLGGRHPAERVDARTSVHWDALVTTIRGVASPRAQK